MEAGAHRRPRYVIHIGPHKTGSTYLQVCFKASAAQLKMRGILFPDLWQQSCDLPSHTGLPLRLVRGEFEQLSSEFLSLEATGVETVLISCEDISLLGPESFDGLRRCLDGASVSFVFHMRRWSELIPSAWQENVKVGDTRTIPEWVLNHVRNPSASPLLNWQHKIASAVQAFGSASVHLVALSLLQSRGVDICQHFMETFLNWPQFPLPFSRRLNVSRDIREITLMRTFNVMATRHRGQPNRLIRERFDARRSSIDLATVFSAMDMHRKTLPFHDNLPPLKALHAQLFAQLKEMVVKPSLPSLLFRPEKAEFNYIGSDYLAEPGIASRLRGIYLELAAA